MKDYGEKAGISYGSGCYDKSPQKKADPFTMLTIMLILAAIGYLLFQVLRTSDGVDLSSVKSFSTVFVSILMQAFPFMLIGIFVSSALHVFVPDGFIIKVFPEKNGLGFLTSMFAGLLFPVCECAIVPVMTRLVKKGVALPIAITFMLSAPIINPIVIISTFYAFPGEPVIALYRVLFGLVIALITGLVLLLAGINKSVLKNVNETLDCDCCGEHEHTSCCHSHNANGNAKLSIAEKIEALFLNSGEEFFSVGKYLVIGAFITSLILALVPRSVLAELGASNGLSLIIMMVMAFLFSACSTSDAFIARSFVGRFSMGAVMGFLVFGPMMDVKNILMLFADFKKGFVIKLTGLIIVLNFLSLYLFSFLF